MRYLKTAVLGFAIWCFGFLLVPLVSFFITSIVYPAFLEWFPDSVPEYNFVNEREKYEQFYLMLDVISVSISIAILSYISVRLDNDRMEYMIKETDGMYTMREGIPLYFKRNIGNDLLSSVLIPFPLFYIGQYIIPALRFLPESAVGILSIPMGPTNTLVAAFGSIGAYFFMAALFFLFRLLSSFRVINIWRVIWLSDIQYLG